MLAVVVATSTPAVAEPRFKTLAPSSPWNVNYADDSCQLLRSFGAGRERITLRLERFSPGTGFGLTLGGLPLKTGEGLYRELKVRFIPSATPARPISALAGTFGEAKTPMLMMGAALRNRPDEKGEAELGAEEETKITALEIDQKFDDGDYVLALGSMNKPMSALRACVDELLSHWGIDAAAQRTLSRRAEPVGNPGTWLRPGDFPRGALNDGNNALVNFRMTVDAKGSPSACAVQGGTRGPEFQDVTCRLLMKRAQFRPALDAQGKPIASYWVSSVRWVAG